MSTSLLSFSIRKKTLRSERFLNEMHKVIDWKAFERLIQPYYYQNKMGRKAFPLLLMIKIYCLQQWYQLSDPGMEDAIYDRLSFQKFLDCDICLDKVPDESTILHFRHLLERHELTKKIFDYTKNLLAKKGLLMNEGTLVDASLIHSPTSTKNKDKSRDPDMSSTKKGNQWHFGMKMHLGLDKASGLIHSLETSTAKEHDSQFFPYLLHGKENSIFGDKAYANDYDKAMARDAGIYWGVLDKAKPNHPLSNKQHRRNWRHAKIRATVEFPFQVIKHLWGYHKTRYRGLIKNTSQIFMLCSLYNLFKVRKKLIQNSMG